MKEVAVVPKSLLVMYLYTSTLRLDDLLRNVNGEGLVSNYLL